MNMKNNFPKMIADYHFTDKVCLLDMKYTEDICYNLTHKKEVPKEMSDAVQSRVAELAMYDGILGEKIMTSSNSDENKFTFYSRPISNLNNSF